MKSVNENVKAPECNLARFSQIKITKSGRRAVSSFQVLTLSYLGKYSLLVFMWRGVNLCLFCPTQYPLANNIFIKTYPTQFKSGPSLHEIDI